MTFQDKSKPLSMIRNHPKFYRLFRTIVSPVGAFCSIKFGQFGGIIEVGGDLSLSLFALKLEFLVT